MTRHDYSSPRKRPLVPEGTGWTLLIAMVSILILIYAVVGFLDWTHP